MNKEGNFTEPDITMEQKIDKLVQIAVSQMNMPEGKTREMANNIILKLKRWQNKYNRTKKMIFGKKRTEREDDKIWATKILKLNGICDEITKEIDRKFAVLTIVHFEKTLEELRKIIDARGLQYKVFKTNWDISNFNLNKFVQEEIKTIVFLSRKKRE